MGWFRLRMDKRRSILRDLWKETGKRPGVRRFFGDPSPEISDGATAGNAVFVKEIEEAEIGGMKCARLIQENVVFNWEV